MDIMPSLPVHLARTVKGHCACRRRAVEKSDGEEDDGDEMDDDQFDEEEGDNEVDGHMASSGISSIMDGATNREEDAQREAQRQRNLEQALLIQMEMQKKLHEQLEVSLQQVHARCQVSEHHAPQTIVSVNQ